MLLYTVQCVRVYVCAVCNTEWIDAAIYYDSRHNYIKAENVTLSSRVSKLFPLILRTNISMKFPSLD